MKTTRSDCRRFLSLSEIESSAIRDQYDTSGFVVGIVVALGPLLASLILVLVRRSGVTAE